MPFLLTMPKLSPTMEEGTIAKWHKREGEYVEADALLVDITTDKATIEHTALDAGWLRKILLPEGATARINEPLALFTEEEKEEIDSFVLRSQTRISHTPSEPVASPSSLSARTREERRRASPLARRIAKEKGVDLSRLTGTGPAGRITSKDVFRALAAGVPPLSGQAPAFDSVDPEGAYEEIPLSPMRAIIARRLQEAKRTIPHFYLRQCIDAEPLVDLHAQGKKLGHKITLNDLLLRAVALALKEHPELNGGYHETHHTFLRFKSVDIAIAVTVETGGILTPLLRHADQKSLLEIATERQDLVERARKGKLQEREYKGGSFCISNMGMYGITEFTAIINPPHAAILAVGAITEEPVVRKGVVVPGKRLVLTLSADHRVVDGALVAAFMKTLQNLLENPSSLLL